MVAAGTFPDALVDLFLVLLAAKIGDEVFRRLGQPAIVGEILAGVAIGPAALDLVQPTDVLEVFAELGVVFLLFWVGLETRISDLVQVGRAAALVGVLGIAVPFAGGVGFAAALGESGATQIFVAAALVATSVGITSAVLVQLGLVRSLPARMILGAAVVDDILAMILLAVAAGIAGTGGVDVMEIAVVVGLAGLFVAFVALGGTRALRARPQLLTAPRFAESPLLPAVLLCLGLAAFAAWIGLAAVIGAFLAGMMVAETKDQHAIEEQVAPLYAFFPPFFFVFVGMQVDLDALVRGGTLGLLALLVAVAVATKFVGAWLGAVWSLGSRQAAFVGVGMVPRGEVGIIVAGIGRDVGVVDDELFALIVAMSIVTTLAAPPFMARLRAAVDDASARAA
jgi:Kef-type K+ transport system membrane component KefB